jgi:hypothetical protein
MFRYHTYFRLKRDVDMINAMEQNISWPTSQPDSQGIPCMYGIRGFTNMSTRALHWNLSWARLTHSTFLYDQLKNHPSIYI